MLKNQSTILKGCYIHRKKINGEFVRISWEQALDEIASKMKKLKKKFGPTSILHSYDYASGGLLKGLGQRVFNFFCEFTEVNRNLCWGSGIQAQAYDFGDSLSHDVNDIKNTKVIIIWGRNITTTNNHLYPFIMESKRAGAELIVIDPIKNSIAKEASQHIAIHPGMDGILAFSLIKIIIYNNWIDVGFIENHTMGFMKLKGELEDFSPQAISEEINVDYQTIYNLVKLQHRRSQ